MAVIFFGTPHFAVPSLKALIDRREDVILVVTQPDKLKGRGHKSAPPPVKEFAIASGIDVVQPHVIREDRFFSELRALNPELIVVAAYGKILPKAILNIPAAGCINIHASLLPKYRGAAPIQWALINGEKFTGVTTMLMDEGLDTGNVLLQETLNIDPEDTSLTLSQRLAILGAGLLIRTMDGMRAGTVMPVPQKDNASYAPLLKKEDGKINWDKSAEELACFVRGMYPWPAAFCYIGNERIKIIKARASEGEGLPGRIESVSGHGLLVGTQKGLLWIGELQPEGKRVMTAEDFINGRRLKVGNARFS